MDKRYLMENKLIQLDNLERILIENIHLDITNAQNRIVNLRSFILNLKSKGLKDKGLKDKIDEEIKEIEGMMNDLGIDFEEKIKNNDHYSSITKDILIKLFNYENDVLSKCSFYKRLDLVGLDNNIKCLINYIVTLNQSIFDKKETSEETIKYIKKEAAEIDAVIKKLDLGE